MRKKMDDLKFEVKEEIVKTLSKMYLDKGNPLPNWSEDEEIVIDADEFKYKVLIDVNYESTTSGYAMEQHTIEEFRITCGGDLYFVWGEGMNERSWTDSLVEELVGLYEFITNEFNRR
jgi:hypothetical protein